MTGADRAWLGVGVVALGATLALFAIGVPAPAIGTAEPVRSEAPAPAKPATGRPVPVAPRPVPEGASRTTLPNGVAVTELRAGDGLALQPGSTAVLEYTAWTADGQVAGSSFRRAVPTRLPLPAEAELAGWQHGLVGLRAGGLRQIHQPEQPGPEGRSRPALTYEVELLTVLVPPTGPLPVPEGGWTALPGGIEVHDAVIGEGPEITAGVTASFDYAVFLPDGTRLDGSWDRSAPVRLPIGAGKLSFEPGLIGARVGGRRQLRLPPGLAPAAEGRPSPVPEGTRLLVILEPRAVE